MNSDASTMKTRRLDWIDVAKGIGILLVVYGHVIRGLESGGIIEPNQALEIADSVIYSFHMPLFFFLSGLLLDESLRRRGWRMAILSKVDTILYPYIIWSLLQGFIEVALSRYTNGGTTVTEVLSLLWQPRAQFWFLYALFQIFVISSILLSIKRRWIAYGMAVSGALSFWLASPEDFGPFIHASRMLIFFVLGVIFFRQGGLMVDWTLKAATISGILFVAAQYIFHGVFGLLYSDRSPLSLALACVGIFFTITLSQALPELAARMMRYMGKMSIYIYLMHILAASGARSILLRLWPDATPTVHVVVGLAAGFVLPLVAARACERLGFMWLFRMPGTVSNHTPR